MSNLHQKLESEHTNMLCSFAPFAWMRLKNFVLANFANKRTCLCTQHQNYTLKLKMLRKYTGIPTNPEAFVKCSDQKILSIIDNIKQQDFTYDIWKKVVHKGKTFKKKWKWSLKPSIMLNLKPFCKRVQQHFAAILAGLQRNSENRSTSNRIFHQIMSTFIWILPKIIGADCKMRSSLPIGFQIRSLSILSWCTIKHRIQKKAVTKALCLFRISPAMTQYLSIH